MNMSQVFDPTEDLKREAALFLCKTHLESSWTSLAEDDFGFELNPGVVNRIYICSNKKTNDKVLIRLYGGSLIPADKIGSIMVRSIGHEGEVLIFHLLAEAGIGPKLLGIFSGGRIEQFFDNCDTISNEDIYDEKVMESYARKLAKLHSMSIPISKRPKDYIRIIRETLAENWDNFQAELKKRSFPEGTTDEVKQLAQKGMEYDFHGIIDWLEETLPRVKTRIVFSHNDNNRANCLVHKDKSVTLLDFELCGYNYRGSDIGMHFKCRTFDIKAVILGRKQEKIPYPSEEERRFFVREYLKAAKPTYETIDDSIDNEDHLLLEAEFFGCLYQLFFVVYMMKDQMLSPHFPGHPAVVMGNAGKDLEDRKERAMKMMGQLDS